MSGKNQYQVTFFWQSASPVTGFLPVANPGGSIPASPGTGTMSSTNTIYSQIINIAKMDNAGLEVTWTGTPTGTFSVQGSVSGKNFYDLTFSPALAQPAGSGSGYLIDLSGYPFTYILLKYINASGSGVLTVYGQFKDLN